MPRTSKAEKDHLRELLRKATGGRDQLPYTPEFDALKQEFHDRTQRGLTDSEFWTALVTVAKLGGAPGRPKRHSAPSLTDAQKAALREVLPVPIGQRDRLPYTDVFAKAVRAFNLRVGLALSEREVWLAILTIAK